MWVSVLVVSFSYCVSYRENMQSAKLCRETLARCRNPRYCVPVFLLLILLYLLDMSQLDIYFIRIKSSTNIDPDNSVLVQTTGCRIPLLNPYDKSILKYIFKVKPFTCGGVPPLVESNTKTLHIREDIIAAYNVTNITSLECAYQPFWRVDPEKDATDTQYGYGDWKTFNSTVNVQDEYVQVACKVNNTEIYKDIHSFVPIKKNHTKHSASAIKLNVLVVGLDSISRANFQRQMPQTQTFLREKLNAVEMIGYNKVGDNTFPNLIPILTGLTVDELTEKCWNSTKTKFDACPFIWKDFSKADYLTAYAEDASWMGVFNYVKRGFQKQPTDYYWRTFDYLAEKIIGHNKPYNAELCIGPRAVYMVLLNYIQKFVTALRDRRYFGFFWETSLSHDNLNYPALGDTNYLSFFKSLHQDQTLNHTILIVLSDHGMRWGDIRSTHQGHLEERLPFLFLALPEWFSDVYPTAMENLQRNSKRLTTPFDLHETLRDILHINKLAADKIKSRAPKLVYRRGISLFLPVPDNRTCEAANISSHWCTCQKSIELDKNDSMVVQAADFIVEHLNSLLEEYKQCVRLDVDGIIDARLLKSKDYLENKSAIHDYTLIIRTKPGDGLFEATVRCVDCEKSNPFDISGTVSRLNLYGNQSACITDFHLKLYCYCGS